MFSEEPAAIAGCDVDTTQLMFVLFSSQVSTAGTRRQAEHAGVGAQEIHGDEWCVIGVNTQAPFCFLNGPFEATVFSQY